MATIRITYQTAAVLHSLATGAEWGFDIIDRTGLGAGTVYPILRRLEAARLVKAQWEAKRTAHAEDRPPRRYYQLTAKGVVVTREALERFPHVGLGRVIAPKPA